MTPQQVRSFSMLYADAAASTFEGGCPIEAGLILKLADGECEHGRLPGDRSAPCGCWPAPLDTGR